MVNAALLQQTLEHIKANPNDWDQHRWTTCFAGLAIKVSGVEPTHFGSTKLQAAELLGLELTSETCDCGCGATFASSHELFGAYNTLDDLEEIVQDLVAEALLSA